MHRRDLLRLLLGALALAGLLAMHGLAAHGTTGPTAHPAGHHALNADHADHADHGTSAAPADTAGHDHRGHDMAELCLALLVGFALAALLRLGSRRGLLLRRTWQPARWTPYHRSSDPPDLATLCLLRC